MPTLLKRLTRAVFLTFFQNDAVSLTKFSGIAVAEANRVAVFV